MDNFVDMVSFFGKEQLAIVAGDPLRLLNNSEIEKLNAMINHYNFTYESVIKELNAYGMILEADKIYTLWGYGCHLTALLLKIKNEIESSSDLRRGLTTTESMLIENSILVTVEYSLRPAMAYIETDGNTSRMFACIKILSDLLSMRSSFTIHDPNNFVKYAGVLLESIFMLQTFTDFPFKEELNAILSRIKQYLPADEMFKILFYMKTNRKELRTYQKIIHEQLLGTLSSSGGFKGLCLVLIQSLGGLRPADAKLPTICKSCEVISNIIAAKGHKKRFYTSIIKEICDFLVDPAERENLVFQIAAVQCLSSLQELHYKEINDIIHKSVLGRLDVLAEPTDLLKGIIIYSEMEFIQVLDLVHLAFCVQAPSNITLPSKLLIPYLPLFTQIYAQFQDINHQMVLQKLRDIIIRCLSNRDDIELCSLIDSMLFGDPIEGGELLHPLILFQPQMVNGTDMSFIVRIGSNDVGDEDIMQSKVFFYDPSTTVTHILIESNHTILIYNVFIHLLEFFSIGIFSTQRISTPSDDSLIYDPDDFAIAIENRFKKNLMIISALNMLIMHKPLHSQFNDKPGDLLQVFDTILKRRIDMNNNLDSLPSDPEMGLDELLLIVLSLLEEIMQQIHCNDRLEVQQLYSTLDQLKVVIEKSSKPSTLVLEKIESILHPPATHRYENSRFETARLLITDATEPHLKVYGITEIIKLLSTNDTETLSNAHALLAITIKLLRNAESYVYLNCIRLITALMNVIGGTVLDTLIVEYHQQEPNSVEDIDYRLKIGESILMVVEGLGPMCYKFKNVLISCFLRGAHNADNEYRTSNLSNLGAILRILSYQVHQFFEELIGLVEDIIQHDTYPPARRAATLVLAKLLAGIPKLIDFEECLLPIFRLLNRVVEEDEDREVRVHAQNGLIELNKKVKEFLQPEIKLEKEIKILGIKDTAPRKKGHILEILD